MSEELRNKLGYISLERTPAGNDTGDNLAIALATYFDGHIDRPENDPDDESGWGKWVSEKTDKALDYIIEDSEIQSLQAERSVYREALNELVRLKDMKDLNGDSPDYRERKPLAWEAARKILAQYTEGGQDARN